MKKSLYILVLAGLCGGVFAQGVVDFDNVPWMLNGDTINGGPIINSNAFVVTDGTPGETRSAWFRDPLYVGAFQASFTYQDVGGGGADGIGFVLQNDPRGTNAIGYTAGGLGYCDITQSVSVLFNIYNGEQGGSGLMIGTNGVGAEDLSGATNGNAYQSTAPVNLASGDPINVSLHYDGATLQVTLTDAVANCAFQTNVTVNIPAFVSSNIAWAGITGSEGDGTSYQIVSNFTFAPLPTLGMTQSGSNNLTFSWPASIHGYLLQSKSSMANLTWAPVSAQTSYMSSSNQVSLYSPKAPSFYRLITARKFSAAAISAKGSISMSGNGIMDSFNSANPLYSSNGLYVAARRRDRAIVLTDSGAAGAISCGTIYGYVRTGPTGTVTGGPVGDAAFIAAGGQGIEPGHFANNANVQLPDVAAPFAYAIGLPVMGSVVYNGTNYSYFAGTGEYSMASLSLAASQKMLITGEPTILYINGSMSLGGQSFIYIAPGASLRLYVNGNASIAGNGIVNGNGVASSVGIYGMPSCTSLGMGGFSQFIGTVYAPDAVFTYASNADFSGSLSADAVSVAGSGSIHIDEGLVDTYL